LGQRTHQMLSSISRNPKETKTTYSRCATQLRSKDMTTPIEPLKWIDNHLLLLDQRLLPGEEHFVHCKTLEDAHASIRDMVVRGAPAIGFTAIYGLALWLQGQKTLKHAELDKAASFLKTARPTAVNLMYETDRVTADIKRQFADGSAAEVAYQYTVKEGNSVWRDQHAKNLFMAETALKELTTMYGDRKLTLMTHCNTGVLACGVLGTALGVISHAHQHGRVGMVYADETRPYMQGTRLTAYELAKENIPYNIVVEGAASYVLSHQKVDAIFVGADRIAANGDTANKVGTATLAVVAKYYNVPFYVVAPLSSFDFDLKSGAEIEIELRHEDEILKYKNHQVSPLNARALNPSFDVTPSSLITGIISERGIVHSPNLDNMKVLCQQ